MFGATRALELSDCAGKVSIASAHIYVHMQFATAMGGRDESDILVAIALKVLQS